ncbi:MAG TPA: YIP1 family protein [Candidatus Dormibacteraeota bacterium]|nr:YIP1 family protein [Candidatus Dormibacteraeota bacterium]
MEGERNPAPGSDGAKGEQGAASISALQSIIGVFANPRKTFEGMVAKPRFLIPLILVVLAQAAFAIAIFESGIVKSDAIAKMEAKGKPPEMVDAMEKFFDSPAAPIIGATTAVVVTAFVLLFNSAILFFIGNLMLGARLRFQHYLCVAAHAAVVGLVDVAVRLGLALEKGTLDVRLGLGNLFGEDPGFLGRFLDTLSNPLMLWSFAVSSVGVSVFAKKSFSFGVLVVLPAFLIGAVLSGISR